MNQMFQDRRAAQLTQRFCASKKADFSKVTSRASATNCSLLAVL